MRRYLLLILLLCASLMPQARAQLTNGQAADVVLGQADFISNGHSTTASTMYYPNSVAVDPTTGKVFVGDVGGNRVLRFGSATSLASGASAESVLGQADFTSSAHAISQTGLQSVYALAFDASGNLYVSDNTANRVLRYNNASGKATGAGADGVLGQADFTSSAAAVTQNGLNNPRSMAVSSTGSLFVADFFGNRILRYDNAAAKANGANADAVLGQSTFTTNTSGCTADLLYKPIGAAIDAAGSLFISDGGNFRVVRYDNAGSKANGASADGVLGQPDLTSDATPSSVNGSMAAAYLAVDAGGTLYASDIWSNRVLIFSHASAKANGANADGVIGHADFTTGSSGVTASTLNLPQGVAVLNDPGGKLFVADAYNSRILRYSPGGSLGVHADAGNQIPAAFALAQNYPNPFNPATTISYQLKDAGFVSLSVYDILGREVARLVNGFQQPGSKTVSFHADNLQSGVYYYRLSVGSMTSVKQMVLLK